MTDQDEFAPLGRFWKPAYYMFMSDASADDVAQHARKVLKVMIRRCGGCPVLPALFELLNDFREQISSRMVPGWDFTAAAERELFANLDRQALAAGNRRIDQIAVRTCRIEALRIAQHNWTPRSTSAEATFTAHVLENVIRHCCLDRARAHAVGAAYDQTQSRQRYNRVFAVLQPSLDKLGAKLANDPSGQFRSRDKPLVAKKNTASILASDAYDMEP